MAEVKSCLNADGSLTVWASGWQATFPAGGEAPACAAAGVGPAEAAAAPPDVLIAERKGRTFVRYGDWIVIFGSTEPEVRPAKPDLGSGPVYLGGLDDVSRPDA